MALLQRQSLFDQSGASPMASSLEWINGVLFGQIAVGLCVLAVAFVGFQMLTGRLALRRGLQVILGCFVLLGAPVIAAGFVSSFDAGIEPPPPLVPTMEEFPPRDDLPPASRDPYSGA